MKDNKKTAKKIRKKRKVRKSFLAAVFILIVAVFVIMLTTVLMPISKVEIQYNGKKYTKEEILAVADIAVGDNILMLFEGSVNKKVTAGLPYIGSVELKKQLPDKVTVIPKETKAVFCIKHKKKYALLDSEFKVLEITNKAKTKLTNIKGLVFSKCEVGKTAIFKDDTAYSNAKNIIKLSNKSNNKVNKLDVSSKFDINLTINGKYAVELGTSNDLTEKLSFMNKMIEKIESKHKNNKGTIDLSYFSEKKEGYFTRGEIEETYK